MWLSRYCAARRRRRRLFVSLRHWATTRIWQQVKTYNSGISLPLFEQGMFYGCRSCQTELRWLLTSDLLFAFLICISFLYSSPHSKCPDFRNMFMGPLTRSRKPFYRKNNISYASCNLMFTYLLILFNVRLESTYSKSLDSIYVHLHSQISTTYKTIHGSEK